MFKNLIIKKVVAASMLIVFAFSVTPTILFHNWFANHTDSVKKIPANDQDQVCKQVFNCHCDNIVAESPFTEPTIAIRFQEIEIFSIQEFDNIVHFYISSPLSYSLRGPPAV